jgi:hypothetical protein
MMLYTVRAYPSKEAAESGKVGPSERSNTGSYDTALHYAKAMAEDHGYAILVNNVTNNRAYFERKTK